MEVNIASNNSVTSADLSWEFLDFEITIDLVKIATRLFLAVLCAAGMAGNVFLFRVAHFMVVTKNKTGYVLMKFIAGVDFAGLGFLGFFNMLAAFAPINQHNEANICKLSLMTTFTCYNISISTVTAMSVERVYAAFNPIGHRDKVTKAMMTKVALGCFVYQTAITALITLVPYIGNHGDYCFSVNPGLDEEIGRGVTLSVLGHTFVLPSALVLVCTMAATARVVYGKMKRSDANVDYTTFKIVLATGVVFLASNVLLLAYALLRSIFVSSGAEKWSLLLVFVETGHPILIIIQCSMNFPVFCLISKNFRDSLKLV